ncbi:HAMP domain-containing histidine kinase [Marichromatium gracile]|uniref:sensor histidine kinase n=1 Tax=Marichromatium gracile TaxID=1048 RepID=UPI001F4822CB|nr:HAMP domain-containing sensor histidine kinase [Marichromatium gracile]MCF1184433.1 HAMP domain-containing histidine kinase [Marichromatium gracile]
MDFSDILASSIHDIKNSLGLIFNSLDDLVDDPSNQLADPRKASLIKHEVQRANNNLVQLLTLYKLGNAQLATRIAEHNLEEFCEEVVAECQAVCTALGLELDYDCDPELTGYFDWELVRGVLTSSIGNAQRYARARIRLSAAEEQGMLVIRVEDDGAGFPAAVIGLLPDDGQPDWSSDSETAPGTSRTRLGLYFAHQVARLHHTPEAFGRIGLSNAHHLPGGCFELWLP